MLSINSTVLFSFAGLLFTSLVLLRARLLRAAKLLRSSKR